MFLAAKISCTRRHPRSGPMGFTMPKIRSWGVIAAGSEVTFSRASSTAPFRATAEVSPI